jgi:hypothetical protein
MFDLLTERPDIIADQWSEVGAKPAPHSQEDHDGRVRTIQVLVISTTGGFPVVEQCLRYMSQFECVITQAGSPSAAQFAVAVGVFDAVVTDTDSLDIVVKSGTANFSTIVVSELDDLSPRLLEAAISRVLRGEQALS